MTINSFINFFVFTCIILLSPVKLNADVSIGVRGDDTFGSVFYVVIGGFITAQDQKELISNMADASAAGLRLAILGSEGGDLHAAMMMGRYLREHRFDTMVLPNSVCYSACVFLLAAGIDKKVQGFVGIHRPYYTSGDPALVSKSIKKTKIEVETFFDEMNIPIRLAEDMFSVDPTDMRILSEEELKEYRLNSKDYVAQEADAIDMIERLGVSREDYEAFLQDLNYTCKIFMGRSKLFKSCLDDVMKRHNLNLR